MRKRSMTVLATTILASGVLLGAQTPATKTPPSTAPAAPGQGDTTSSKSADHAFITEAAMGGMAEVDLGRLATTKATN